MENSNISTEKWTIGHEQTIQRKKKWLTNNSRALASLLIEEEMQVKIYIKSAKIFYFLNENSQR